MTKSVLMIPVNLYLLGRKHNAANAFAKATGQIIQDDIGIEEQSKNVPGKFYGNNKDHVSKDYL